MSSWNAYKIFANGKRAKMPYTTFEADESQHFFENILPTLSPKLQKANWLILNTNESQEREAEQRDEEKERYERKKISFLSKLAAKKHPNISNRKTEACLMMNKDTDWKWAWCVAEGGTLNFLGQLSELFDIQKEAEEWLRLQLGTLHTKSEI